MQTYQSQSKENGGIIIIPSGALTMTSYPTQIIEWTLHFESKGFPEYQCVVGHSLCTFSREGFTNSVDHPLGGSKSQLLYYNRGKMVLKGREGIKNLKKYPHIMVCV